MKKIIIMMLVAVVSLGASAQGKEKGKAKGPQKEKVTFTVAMDCPSCKAAIEKTIPFEKGVRDLAVDFEGGKVTVTFDPQKTNRANLVKALNNIDSEIRVTNADGCCTADKACADKACADKKACCTADKACADKACADKKECCAADKACADKACADKKECPKDKKCTEKPCADKK